MKLNPALLVAALLFSVSCAESAQDGRTGQNADTPNASMQNPYGTNPYSNNPYGPVQPNYTPQPVYSPQPVYTPQPGFTPPQTASACYKADDFACRAETAMLPMINQLRQQRGLAPVALDPKLSFVAREWSKAQAARRSISHSGFPSMRSSTYRQEFGVLDVSIGSENVAMFSYGQTAPESAAAKMFEQWRTSPGHLRNMLGRHQLIGIGMISTQNGSVYGTQIFGDRR